MVYTFVRKLYHCMKQAKHIHRQISGYGLFEELESRLEVAILGGVARSTIYKAFSTGGGTPKTDIILQIAEDVVCKHLEKLNKEIPANEPVA